MNTERELGPDAVRAAAALLVICVHFFLNAGFYELPLLGGTMALSAFLRMLCMTCVPMFLLLSGYLCSSRRRWAPGYLKGLIPFLLTWLLAACACLLFRRFRLGETIGVPTAIMQIINFSAVPYGWYAEMYLGLYLLMPFLNAAWNGSEPGGKRALTAVLGFLCILPQIVNIRDKIIPDWWSGIYPLFYYYLGALLRERPLRSRGWLLLCGWIAAAAAAAAVRWIFAAGGVFSWASYTDWASPFVAAESVCLFSLLIRTEGRGLPQRLISGIAGLSLPIYLFSFITDQLVYPVLNGMQAPYRQKLLLAPAVVAVDFVFAAVPAFAADTAARKIAGRLPEKRKKDET